MIKSLGTFLSSLSLCKLTQRHYVVIAVFGLCIEAQCMVCIRGQEIPGLKIRIGKRKRIYGALARSEQKALNKYVPMPTGANDADS